MADWTWGRRILCVRLDGMGDLLMTSPAIRAVCETNPGAEVALLTSPAAAPVGRMLPGLADVLVYEAPWMKTEGDGPPLEQDLDALMRLGSWGFESAVIFTVYSQSSLPAALMLRLAGIPQRAAHARENPYALLTNWLPEHGADDGGRHEVRRQLDLVGNLGCVPADERLRIDVPAGAFLTVDALLRECGIDTDRPWVLIHPGATAPSRRYPPELLGAAVRGLHESGVLSVMAGGPGNLAVVGEVQAAAGIELVSLAGLLDVPEMAALIQRAPLLLANNSGPVHIAAAMETPVVDLYALTNRQHTPWQVPSRVLFEEVPCAPCYRSVCPEGHHRCLRGVTPERVTTAALELLKETRGRPAAPVGARAV